MRFEFRTGGIVCYVAEAVITWVDNGIIYSTKHRHRHPLVKVYWNICKDNRLQTINTDVDSQKTVLILIASLVLL